MTDLATADAPTTFSTTLDNNVGTGAAGAGEVRSLPDEGKPEAKEPASLRDTIADAVKNGDKADAEGNKDEADAKPAADPEDGKAKDEKAEADKAKPDEVKAAKERAEDGKFKAKAAEVEGEGDNIRETDANKDTEDKPGHYQPPKALLPDAREKWVNVPRTVQRDIDNMARQHEAEVTQLREATERYEPLREYDELVRQNGREGLHETLKEVQQLEDLMEKNPVAALNQVLQRAGPRKPDGQPFSLYEVATALAQQGPEGYQRMVAQASQQGQQQPQENPEVAQLKQQITQMQQQQITSTVIEPFKQSHPRYQELNADIAMFLKSGRIPASLSEYDRLEAAYDMAERLNPPSNVSAIQESNRPDPDRRADTNLSGSKSIKSAPGSVTPDLEPDRGGSIRDLLASELKRQRA